ncbi:DNA polymerase III subunit beta [Verrucomicrobiota bacterium sgz303538]
MSSFALPIAALKPALTGLGKVLNRQTRLPVLSMIKIERTKEGRIILTTSDRDHFVSFRMDGPKQPQESEPEALLVPFDELLAVTKSCGKGEQILIQRDGPNFVSIRYAIGSQYAEYKVERAPVEEFPEIPVLKGEPVTLPDSLRCSILQAFECASTDDTRQVLNSAYLDVGQRECQHVVATDGRHLFSSNSFTLPLGNSIILPTHRFLQWREFHRDGEWRLRVAAGAEKDGPAHIQVSSRHWRFITSEPGGNYPNWRQVVPSSSEMKSSFELEPHTVEQMIQAIQRMPCHDPLHFAIGLEMTGNAVHLIGKTGIAEHWIRVPVPAVRITGKTLATFLNRNYLLKALRFGLTRIELIDPMSPLRISAGGRQMIIMPVRSEAVPPPPATSVQPEPSEPPTGAEVDPRKPPTRTPSAPPPGKAPPAMGHTRQVFRRTKATSSPKAAPAEADAANTAARVDGALHAIDSLRETLQRGLSGLRELSHKLRLLRREQTSTGRELPPSGSSRRTLPDTRREH